MYYGVSICLVSAASGLSVVTLNVHHRGVRGSGVPKLLRKLVLGPLARVAFVHFDPTEGQTIQQPPPPAKYKPQVSLHFHVSLILFTADDYDDGGTYFEFTRELNRFCAGGF